ncbi:MAG TPA: 50S ribosomal protein L24 [Candidatus Saccharimonadales bacterium]|nr:50S ribosomal protein L24 [Candidatus Saccharimonadales bacterium]
MTKVATKAKIRKGDKVLVITGKDRHKTGVVERVFPSKQLVVITGINMAKKHMKRSQKYPQGGIIDMTVPIHISNVMLLDPQKNKPTRVGYRVQGEEKVRFGKLSNEVITKGEAK